METREIDQLNRQLADLGERLAELKAELENRRPGEKTLFRFLVPIIASAIISLAATYATMVYNERQMQLAQIEALDKYRSYLNSADERQRRFGYQAFIELGYEDFVIKLIDDRADPAGINIARSIQSSDPGISIRAEETADRIMARAAPEAQRVIPEPVSSTEITETKSGWIYLGHYVAGERKWKTRYLEFAADAEPESLPGKTLAIRKATGSLNVRQGMPTFTGQFRDVIEVLSPGSRVVINSIDEWHSSGYLWAQVSYGA